MGRKGFGSYSGFGGVVGVALGLCPGIIGQPPVLDIIPQPPLNHAAARVLRTPQRKVVHRTGKFRKEALPWDSEQKSLSA